MWCEETTPQSNLAAHLRSSAVIEVLLDVELRNGKAHVAVDIAATDHRTWPFGRGATEGVIERFLNATESLR